MKFTNGFWEIKPEVTSHYVAQAREVQLGTNELTVYAPEKRINHRGDTLNIGVMTIRYSSPLPNVIHVQAYHHKGGGLPQPAFEVYEDAATPVQVTRDAGAACLTSGDLTVKVKVGEDWKVEFIGGGKPITSSGWRGLGTMDTPEGVYAVENLNLGVGELVYGLGERFTAFVKNGQVVDLWNEDGGTSSEISYKNIPFYMTNRGYGVFINHPDKVSLEVASEKVERVQFSVPGERLDYYVIYGPDPLKVLERYTQLTGRPALPPAWTFGLWLTTSFTTSYDEATVTSFIDGMAERDLPLHVFHFDCFWMKEFHWCDFKWDEQCFPDPAGMLARLKAKGLKICVWINPYIAQRSYLFDEGMANGYLMKNSDGSVFQWDRWQAGMALVDFTNPAACAWYAGKLRELVKMGVDCFKTDFGERIPFEGVKYYDGSDPVRMHNYYTFLYNQVVFNLLKEELGEGQAAVFARSATAGGQQFPVHWGGDSTATFESMAESLRGGLSLCMSGFGFWSHDIGGFEQTASADVYKRWCAFGLLSSHSRLHGNSSYRVPWQYQEDPGVKETASVVLGFFTRQKCRLMPYLFDAAVTAHETGAPMMRSMPLMFPGDPACDTLDRQYMLGDNLLVAPVLSADGVVDYYLPAGRWTNFITGQVVEGGRWLREQHGYLTLPLLARPNSVIAVGAVDDRPDYDYAEGVELHVFEPADGVVIEVKVPDSLGKTAAQFEVRRDAGKLVVTALRAGKRWALVLRGQRYAADGARLEISL